MVDFKERFVKINRRATFVRFMGYYKECRQVVSICNQDDLKSV